MVASSAPLDQFVVRNPSYFFDASPERALIDPDNLHILVDHIKCAAFELPFTATETFGRHDVQEILGILAEQGLVHRAGDGTGRRRGPGRTSRIRPTPSACGRSRRTTSSIVDTTRRDARHRRDRLHERPVHASPEGHLHRRRHSCSRSSGSISRAGRRSSATIDCDYYTDAITLHEGDAHRHVCARRRANACSASHGEVHVVSRVVGFKKIKFYTNENVGSGELDLPEQQMHTTSYWLTIPAG